MIYAAVVRANISMPGTGALVVRGTSEVKLSRLRRLHKHIKHSPHHTCTCFYFAPGGRLDSITAGQLRTVERCARFKSNFGVTVHSLRVENTNDVLNNRRRNGVRSIKCSVCLGLLSSTIGRRGNVVPSSSVPYAISLGISTRVPRDCVRSLPTELNVCGHVTTVEDSSSTDSIVSRLYSHFNRPPGTIVKLVSVTILEGGTTSQGVTRVATGNGATALRVGSVRPAIVRGLDSGCNGHFVLGMTRGPMCAIGLLGGRTVASFVGRLVATLWWGFYKLFCFGGVWCVCYGVLQEGGGGRVDGGACYDDCYVRCNVFYGDLSRRG